MLKAVIQAIPIYVMSCFLLPVAICEQMRKLIANQWWGMENGKRKLHWRSWEWLSSPKSMGGWDFVTWRFLIRLCLDVKLGG
jgi:hypothetical protein